MSRVLTVRADSKKKAADWHRDVFARYGAICYLHRVKDPRSQVRAIDAAHIVKKSRLGTKLAYISERLGRPLCRPCHDLQEPNLDIDYRFPLADRLDAIRAHNEVAKQKIQEPHE